MRASPKTVTLDCDGDGYPDFVSLSSSGIDCVSASGEVLWHRPPIPNARLCGAFEKEGQGYLTLQTDPQTTGSVFYVDARNGEDCDVVPAVNALSADNPKHSSLIILDDTSPEVSIASIRRSGVRMPSSAKSLADPRYIRLLPWVVNAKFFLLNNPATIRQLSWSRIIKLALGVFIAPITVLWICLRTRFTIRQLLLVASTFALALSLVLADNSAFPTDDWQLASRHALEAAFFIAFHTILLLLPLIELTQSRWRRRLSIGVYVAFLIIIPVVTLLTYSSGVIQTTYSFQEFWHLFWFALLPTGFVILVIQSLRFVYKGLTRIGVGKRNERRWPKKIALTNRIQSAGDSHGG